MKNTKIELNDTELENVSGGDRTDHPHLRPMAELQSTGIPETRPDLADAAPTADEIISELKS